jgi:hypothetical protein
MTLEQISNNTHRFSTLLQIGGIALFALFLTSKLVDLPGYLLSNLALAWMLYVPFCIGSLLTNFPIRSLKMKFNQLYGIKYANIPIRWFLGFIIIISITTFFLHVGISVSGLLGPVLLAIATGSTFLHRRKDSKSSNKIFYILLFTTILGISFAGYVRSFSPFPLTPGTDIFSHLYTIQNILHNSLESPLVYPPTFHMLVALGSDTFKADLTEIFWLGSFGLFSVFSISMYLVSYWIGKNHIHAVIATVIALSVTEQGLVPNLQVFFPSSVIMCIFPSCFFFVDNIWNKFNVDIKHKMFYTSIILSGLILLHLELGALSVLIIVSYLIICNLVKRNNFINFIIKIMLICLTLIVIMYYFGYVNSQIQVSVFQGSTTLTNYNYDIATKIKHLNWWYTDTLFIISLAGLISFSFHKERKMTVIGLLAAFLLVIYFQNVDIIHRAMNLERPLLSFAAAALLVLPVSILDIHLFGRLKILLMNKRKQNSETYGKNTGLQGDEVTRKNESVRDNRNEWRGVN